MPKFTKKQYVKFASILGKSENKEEIIEKMITFFKNDNPKFDEKRFRNAIEKEYEKKINGHFEYFVPF